MRAFCAALGAIAVAGLLARGVGPLASAAAALASAGVVYALLSLGLRRYRVLLGSVERDPGPPRPARSRASRSKRRRRRLLLSDAGRGDGEES